MKILSIGNSFSQDAHRYLAKIAMDVDPDVKTVNICIGGCSFARHYNNMKDNNMDYAVEINGEEIQGKTTLKDALLSDSWDIVTLQEVSSRSTSVNNFEPYMSALAKYIRELCPNAKIALHETWGYESYTHRIKNQGYYTQGEMFADIERAYAEAKEIIDADCVIPSGKVMQLLSDRGHAVHRDGLHASLGLGRYAIALIWVKTLYDVSVSSNRFREFDEDVSDAEIDAVMKAIDEV